MTDLPPPAECWKYIPSDKGDDVGDSIYLSVGKALSAWEMVEGAFAGIFSRFLFSESWAAERAYGTIVGNRARKEMLEAVAEIFFKFKKVSDEDQKSFRLIMEHFRQASAIRNNVAHGYVVSLTLSNKNMGVFLLPPHYNSKKTTSFVLRDHTVPREDISSAFGVSYSYTSRDIDGFAVKFRALNNLALEYQVKLISNYSPGVPKPTQ